jgi:cytochrome oxidase Cu insertion factor (SCO1/SenC/PrrC family)
MKNDSRKRQSKGPSSSPWVLWITSGSVLAAALAGLLIIVLLPTPSAPASVPDASAQISKPAASLLGLDTLSAMHSPMPNFSLTDQNGKQLTLDQFKGRSVVLSFNDDQCLDLCTLLAQDVVTADKDLGSAAKNIAFVSINANPYYPRVASVKQWTDEHGLGHLANWYFGTGNPKTLATLATRYGVPIQLDAKQKTVEHGSQLFFIDTNGLEAAAGSFGTEAASTALFASAMSQLAEAVLPKQQQQPIAGQAVTTVSADGTQLGDTPPASDLRALGSTSTTISTSPPPNQFEVINFWASSCTACVAELPALQAVYKKDGAKTALLGVDVSDLNQSAISFAARAGATYPLASDPDGALAGRFGITGLPYTVILDPNGKVVVRHPGAFTAEQLEYELDALAMGNG